MLLFFVVEPSDQLQRRDPFTMKLTVPLVLLVVASVAVLNSPTAEAKPSEFFSRANNTLVVE